MKRLSITSILFVLMSLLSGIAGCTHLNTYYDYISSEVSEDGVVVGRKLQGAFSSDKKNASVKPLRVVCLGAVCEEYRG